MEFVAGERERERGGQGDGDIEEVGERRERWVQRKEGGENRGGRWGVWVVRRGGFGSELSLVLRRGDAHRK